MPGLSHNLLTGTTPNVFSLTDLLTELFIVRWRDCECSQIILQQKDVDACDIYTVLLSYQLSTFSVTQSGYQDKDLISCVHKYL